jgi:hypothetical protein
MSDINEFSIGKEQQQQQNIHFSATTDVLSFIIRKMSDINSTNITQYNSNNNISNVEFPSLTYKISFGLICACLCLLTITGNLLVLITFRRIRTVSIRLFKLNDLSHENSLSAKC